METDKYITVVSGTHTANNIRLRTDLSFGEDWEVALVQAYIPHSDDHFRDNFKKYFPNNKIIAGMAVHYKTSPSATISVNKHTTLRVDDIIDGVGNGTSKLDVLKMIYSATWNKIMYELRTDASVTAAYPKDSNGNMLHQTLEETSHGVTLKGYALKGGRFSLDKTLAQMMGIVNVVGTGLGSGVHYKLRDNDNIKRIDTFTLNSDEIDLFSGVDWVFTLHTPWSTRYIPEKVYKHVDINCGLIVPQQVNNDNTKYILYHAEIPGDGGLVVPQQRMYMKIRSTSFTWLQIWITTETGALDDTLPFEKSRFILHLRKTPSQTM